MKKVLAVVVLSLFVVTAAFAGTPTNCAIGYDDGLSMRHTLESGLGFQGIIGLGIRSLAADDTDADLDLTIAANVFKCLWEDDKGNLNMFAGVEVMLDGTTTKDGDSNTDIRISIGLEPEVFLSENLSITTKLGVGITLAGDRRGASDTGWTNIATFGDPLGAAAINWYF